MLSVATAALAAWATRRLLVVVWRQVRHQDPSEVPARSSWLEAVTWAAAAGAGVGVARVLAKSAAAKGFAKATGQPPAELATD